MTAESKASPLPATIAKAPSGIRGLDEITEGGLPHGRATLVAGGPGSGKTLLAMEFLVRGAVEQGEPGVFMAFEETEAELVLNAAALGFDLADLVARNLLSIDYVYIERSEIDETGEYNLDGIFVRLALAIDAIGAKRVALDTLEVLFAGVTDASMLRGELRRLFRWLKDRGVTTIITAEQGETTLTRHGLEEYVSDCVIRLDHRVASQVSTRRLRVVKYRGSAHGTNEYPFLIGHTGLSVLPITSRTLHAEASRERVSSGIPLLDAMLGGQGYYRATTVLVSGTAGTGKTSMAAHFAHASAQRGERCLYFTFEESSSQIIRNMESIGLNLRPWVEQGLLKIESNRPTSHGLETHLAVMYHAVEEWKPDTVVIDPIISLVQVSSMAESQAMLIRIIDLLKNAGITVLLTSLTPGSDTLETSVVGISSLIDTWIMLQDVPSGGERNRSLHVLKSRGMAHSNQVREFLITDQGVQLVDVYVGPSGVLTGRARLAQEARASTDASSRQEQIEHMHAQLEHRRQLVAAQVASLETQLRAEEQETLRAIAQQEQQALLDGDTRARLARDHQPEAPSH